MMKNFWKKLIKVKEQLNNNNQLNKGKELLRG